MACGNEDSIVDGLAIMWQVAALDCYKAEVGLDSCSGYKRGKLLLKQTWEQLLVIQIESILKLWWNNNLGHLAKFDSVTLVYK